MSNKQFARIGDGVVNLMYSLALLIAIGDIKKTKLPGYILAEALRASGLRLYLPSRQDRYKLSDAAEALIGYAWLTGAIEIKEAANLIASMINPKLSVKNNTSNVVSAFTLLIRNIIKELGIVEEKSKN